MTGTVGDGVPAPRGEVPRLAGHAGTSPAGAAPTARALTYAGDSAEEAAAAKEAGTQAEKSKRTVRCPCPGAASGRDRRRLNI